MTMAIDAFEDQKTLLSGSTVKNVFDVGAHCGDVTQTYLELFQTATVFSFEPYETSYMELAQRFDANPRIATFKLALDDKVSSRPLYIYSNSRASAFSELSPYSKQNPLNPEKCKFVRTVQVQTTTIDSFCRSHDIDVIDILKLDVQGAELSVLKGAEKMLSNEKIGIVYVELQYQRLYEEAALYYEVAEFLGRQGYNVYRFYNMVYGHDGLSRHGDGIFISNKLFACHQNNRNSIR